VDTRRTPPEADGDRPSSRHDRMVVVGAIVLLAAGVATGAFEAIRGALESRLPGFTGSAFGILVVTCAAVGTIALLQRVRARAERRRHEGARATYRSMLEQVPAVAYAWDPEHEPGTAPADYISPQIQSLLGFPAEQWLDDPELWTRQVHPDDVGAVLSAWSDAVQAGTRFAAEYRMRTGAGHEIWVRDEATPVTVDGATRYRGVIHDVTSEREMLQALRTAEERYRSLVEQLPAVIYVDAVDELVTARYVSPQYERLTGYTPAERLADPGLWMRLVHPDDRERVLEESNRTNETGEDYEIEHRIVHRDGRVVWVHDHGFLVPTADGDHAWQGVLTDVTDRKLAEQALRTRDRILEAAGYAAERFLRAPQWRTCIDDVLERLGLAGSATRAGVFENIDLPSGLHAVLRHAWVADGAPASVGASSRPRPYGAGRARWAAVLSEGGVIHGRTADLPGEERQTIEGAGIRSLIVVPVHVGDEWWGYIGIDACASDRLWQTAEVDAVRVVANTLGAAIEREQAARRLSEAEERYRAIVEHVPAAIYLDRADRSMESIYMSPQVEEITGYTPQEWIDDPTLWLAIMAPEDRAEVERTYLESVTARRPWKAEYRVNTRDGRTIWVHDETTFVSDAQGTPLFLQGVLMDITDRKLAEHALRDSERREREAAERLRALDEMKNTFLAAVSHELRSPLTSILGLSLTLERGSAMSTVDRADLMERLAANARKLDRLLKDLLDIDRLNRGIVEPQYRTVDVAALTRRAVESLDSLADRAIELDVRPLVLTIDPPKIERIVENLVVNAARHTVPTCRIWVRLEACDGGALLSVEDDGPGVPAELRDAIFEPFRRGPTVSSYSPGTGVGLSLVARFAELHGGRAWVDERIGGGSAFRVFLPHGPDSRGAGVPPPAGRGVSARSSEPADVV
jgi:PAS domain S-box-containing protein